ncbi:hypothetical protein AKJ09_03366 [Labilithrix luteola]|uniref:Uncharacterized protein n=1 Tax=Labilithrix luteola TaxID=1391654 RepID=A0A0K1PT69_9BACT|nr:hypothetical protein AKJ09_03366 [Labilithrix luteola]
MALVEVGGDRAVFVAPHANQEVDWRTATVGKGVVLAKASEDGRRLFVVSKGEQGSEPPTLTVFEGATNGEANAARRFELPSAHSALAVDPTGRWVGLYTRMKQDLSGIQAESVVPGQVSALADPPAFSLIPALEGEIQNEVVLVDLDASPELAVSSRLVGEPNEPPVQLWFSPVLQLPAGPRRLLVSQSSSRAFLLELDRLAANPAVQPELLTTLPTSSTTVMFDDGAPDRTDDARIVMLLTESSTPILNRDPVMSSRLAMFTFAPLSGAAPQASGREFETVSTGVDFKRYASEFAFVNTAAGRRIAVLVNPSPAVVFVDPDDPTGNAATMDLAFAHNALEVHWVRTRTAATEGGADAFLLSAGIIVNETAYWSLEPTSEQPFGNVQQPFSFPGVLELLDVPPPHEDLKILRPSGYCCFTGFYVLDRRTLSVMSFSESSAASLRVSPDGRHVSYFTTDPDKNGLTEWVGATVNLDDLTVTHFPLDGRRGAMFDVARPEGGRAIVVLGGDSSTDGPIQGDGTMTVFDAESPKVSTARSYSALLLGAP